MALKPASPVLCTMTDRRMFLRTGPSEQTRLENIIGVMSSGSQTEAQGLSFCGGKIIMKLSMGGRKIMSSGMSRCSGGNSHYPYMSSHNA